MDTPDFVYDHPPATLQETFLWHEGVFYSRTDQNEVRSPVSYISWIALHRLVTPSELELPDGWSNDTLRQTHEWAGAYIPHIVKPEKAQSLRDLGSRLLELDAEGGIQPPLNPNEHDAINHLIAVVDGALNNTDNE